MRRERKRKKRKGGIFLFLLIFAGVIVFYNMNSKYLYNDGRKVTYYSQKDAKWGNELYGESGTIAEAGCGPTCLAIVASTLNDEEITPEATVAWAVKDGQRSPGSGSYHTVIPEGGKEYGFPVKGAGKEDKQSIEQALQDGKLVVAIMAPGHFTKGGHFIVLRGLTKDGKVLVADPNSRMRSYGKWDLDLIIKEARNGAAAGGPFWICG